MTYTHIAFSYNFSLTVSPKPKVRPQNTVARDVTSILLSQNVVTKMFFFYSLNLEFMKL